MGSLDRGITRRSPGGMRFQELALEFALLLFCSEFGGPLQVIISKSSKWNQLKHESRKPRQRVGYLPKYRSTYISAIATRTAAYPSFRKRTTDVVWTETIEAISHVKSICHVLQFLANSSQRSSKYLPRMRRPIRSRNKNRDGKIFVPGDRVLSNFRFDIATECNLLSFIVREIATGEFFQYLL